MHPKHRLKQGRSLRLYFPAVPLLPYVIAVEVLFVHKDHTQLADVAAALRGHQAIDPADHITLFCFRGRNNGEHHHIGASKD